MRNRQFTRVAFLRLLSPFTIFLEYRMRLGTLRKRRLSAIALAFHYICNINLASEKAQLFLLASIILCIFYVRCYIFIFAE